MFPRAVGRIALGTRHGSSTGGGGIPGTGGAIIASDGSDDGGAVVYGIDDWSWVIDCPAPDRCDVDAGFVEELTSDLSVLSDDHIGVHPGISQRGHRGFVFAHVGVDSLPAALGLESGDVLWRIENIELRTVADVGGAFEVLNQATELPAAIDRGSTTLSRTVRLVESLDP